MKPHRSTWLLSLFLALPILVSFAALGQGGKAAGQTQMNSKTTSVPNTMMQMAPADSALVILRADPAVSTLRVAPPPHALSRDGKAALTATFQVNYNPASCSGTVTAWPAAAQTAFNRAVTIWAGLITASQPIVVDACWRSDLGSGVLGSAGADYYRDFTNAPRSNTWYPVPLVNAITNQDINGSTAEIKANFSSTFANWYFGTDGNTPATNYDFVSVVLHEIGHGLGFAGFMNVSSGSGSWGYGTGFPSIYDHFTEDGNGVDLLTYTNNSTTLATALRGGVNGVYFIGANAVSANGGNRVKLYSPSTWSGGSSYSHLDEVFNNTPHALMTYSLSQGESLHHPGSVALGLLKDSGWTLDTGTAPTATPTAVGPTATPTATGTPTPTGTPITLRAIRPGFNTETLVANDDGSTGLVPLGFNLNFYGATYNQLYVNNNGNVTFDNSMSDATPFDLIGTNRVMIAPFFADVDTRVGNVTRYGQGTVDGRNAFGVTWLGVGCFEQITHVLNSFQLVLIERTDTGAGNFDIEFNYDQIQWEAGTGSGGNGNCQGGSAARAGYANGVSHAFELPGSNSPGAFLDTNLETGLIHKSLNSPVQGRYLFAVRNGVVPATNTPTPTPTATFVGPTPTTTATRTPTPTATPTTMANAVVVALPTNAAGSPNSQVTIPVLLPGAVNGHNIISYNFRLTFNPAVLAFAGTSTASTLSNGWTVTPNSNTPGAVQVVAFNAAPLSGSGTLINLLFNVVGTTGSSTALTWTNFVFNEGSPPAQTSNGFFTAALPVAVTLPTNAMGAPNSQVTIPVLLPDTVTSHNIIAYDFRLTFNPAVLSFVGTSTTSTLSNGWTVTPNSSTPGAVQVVAFNATALSGSGTLINLVFNVVGSAGSTTALTWTNFVFNEGSPAALTSNGLFTASAWRVGGSVSYRTTTRTMAGVTIALSGASQSQQTTTSSGIYSFTLQTSGVHTVTPSLSGQVNSISAFDAAYVAQCVAGVRALSDCPLLAADASGNNALSAFDAAQIAQYVAGLAAPNSRVGRWLFSPASRSYGALTGDLLTEGYAAYLVGEVSGNWQAPAVTAADAAATGPAPALATSQDRTVALGSAAPVSDLLAFQMTLHYDPAAGRLHTAQLAPALVAAGWEVVVNEATPGVVELVAYGVTPVQDSHELVTLHFQDPAGHPVALTPTLHRVQFNEESLWLDASAASPDQMNQRQFLPLILK